MRLITASILACVILLSFSRPLLSAETDLESTVKNIIEVVSTKDHQAIANLVIYPLHRAVPLPSINTSDQLMAVFDEVFDDTLLNAIANSSISDDWAEMGWRGIMFKNGILWLEGGKIRAINYETEMGKRKRESLIEADRKKLYSSLQKFVEPIFEWKTKDFRIRIDSITDDKYRYAVWPAQKKTSEKPDLVLNNGDVIYEGSGGNHHYDFKSGAYLYRCSVNEIRTANMPPGELEVYKHNKVVLRQPVIEVIE